MREAKSRNSGLLAFVILAAAAALVGYTALNRQSILDYIHSVQFEPTAEVANIRSNLELTSGGEILFNASEPALESASTFNQKCEQANETTNPILGCYVAQRIYMFDVTNEKLNGIEETTAAHELLHAVYERLSRDERERVDALLQGAYEKYKTAELQQRMEYYRKAEPGQEYNELHSILGTEVPSLGPDLEEHYAKYFADRGAVLAYHDQYSSVFESVSAQIKRLSEAINTRTEAINQRISAYNAEANELQRDADEYSSQEFNSYERSYAARAAIVQKQAELDRELAAIKSEIAKITAQKREYAALLEEYNQLSVSINSSLTPVKSLE